MTVFRLNETFNIVNKYKIIENYTNESIKPLFEYEGNRFNRTPILGIVKGIFFVPNGESANNRYYSEKFWRYVLASKWVKSLLERRIMFGTIGHYDRAVEEQDLENGKISHIVTKLYIDNNKRGMGEAIILDTPAGRNLWTVLAAGSDMKVSTRASGDYKRGVYHTGKNGKQMPVMDETSYTLDTVDFVIFPGFSETNPKLISSASGSEDVDESLFNKYSKTTMLEKVNKVEHSRQKEKHMSKSGSDANLLEARRNAAIYKKRAEKATIAMKAAEERATKAEKASKKLVAVVEQYLECGSVADVKAKLQEHKAFVKIADKPEKLEELLTKSAKVITSLQSLKAEAAKVPVLEKRIEKATQTLSKYVKIGSIAECRQRTLVLAEDSKKRVEEAKSEAIKSLSKSSGLTIEATRKIVENAKDIKSAKATIKALKQEDSRFKGNPKKELSKIKENKKASKKSSMFSNDEGAAVGRLLEGKYSIGDMQPKTPAISFND
jgi:hypothetical protein